MSKPTARTPDADTLTALREAAARQFTPHGTARVRWRLASGGADEATRAALALTPLTLALQGRDLPPELAELAVELVALEPGLGPDDARALLVITLAAIVALEQGSTRLPVGDVEGRGWARELVASLAGSRDAADEVLRRFWALASSNGAPLVLGRVGEPRPLVHDGANLYLQRMLRQEDRFVDTLARRVRAGVPALDPGAVEAALADVLSRRAETPRGPLVLSDEQAAAVARAVSRPLTVISGGPGTGKTSIVVAILRTLARLGHAPESIALAAPTGKAANRIAESVRRSLAAVADPSPEDQHLLAHAPEARTLHRLLGWIPAASRFTHHENNRLAERVVIVDETSMIDLTLMERLVRAVRDDARVVLLGDAEQLPSVDAGAVLRDVVSEAERPGSRVPELAITLGQSFRMDPKDPAGRAILTVARRIRDGRTSALFLPEAPGDDVITVREHVRDVRFSKVELLEARSTKPAAGSAARPGTLPHADSPGQAEREAFLAEWYRRLTDGEALEELRERTWTLGPDGFSEEDAAGLRALFAHFERSRILAVTRSSVLPTGAGALNEVLHAKAVRDARTSGRTVPLDGPLAGEPILVTKNDYERRLFNGDQGVALWVKEPRGERALMGVFAGEGGWVAHDLAALGEEITLAYAMTVHKSQGSEYDDVALVLPDRDLPLLTREILYTALTRARRSVLIVGDRRLLVDGVGRRIHRYSGVREKLGRALEAADGGPDEGAGDGEGAT